MEDKRTLAELHTGEEAIVTKVVGYGSFRKRIMEMGFIRGQRVKVQLNAPLKDPVKYEIMGYEVSLRRSEAQMVRIVSIAEFERAVAEQPPLYPCADIVSCPCEQRVDPHANVGRVINVALVGNPNCGKTSLFNMASGSSEHVGNYSGVTVDAKCGHFDYNGYHFNITDLPGTYSLAAYSPEEVYVRRHIAQHTPDVILNVVVSSNLERNLYLTTELIDMDVRMVMALNMYDELERRGDKLDIDQLSTMLGIPIIPTISRSGWGMNRVFDTIIDIFENRNTTVRHVHINHGAEIEQSIQKLTSLIKSESEVELLYAPRFLAIKMLEGDEKVDELLHITDQHSSWSLARDIEVERIERTCGEDIEMAIANQKYGFIAGAIKETLQQAKPKEGKSLTSIIDSVVTHKWLGFPIFLFLIWLMFETTFTLGQYPMAWIEQAVAWIGQFVEQFMPNGALKDLIIDGIIGGVGGVIVFLPNILILYLFISIMEDTGYMSRAAFIMDKLMHRIGLHGKSFIPLVMGFGCNVPAIIATRSIESKSSRLITMFINPFMSCSARLPVYLLFVGALFPHHASVVLLGLYLTGIVVAILTSLLLRKTYFKKENTPFVMELPPYRIPTSRSIVRHMWEKASQYLQKMGGIILIASIIIWYLSYYPRHEVTKGGEALTPIELREQQEHSYLGQLGHLIEPALAPLGFNWKGGVAILSGVAAKEVVVSTIGVLYQEGGEGDSERIAQKLKEPNPLTGEPDFTPPIALAFMVFVLLYFPCLASVVAIVKESGSRWWGFFSVLYTTGVAWIVAYLVKQIATYLL